MSIYSGLSLQQVYERSCVDQGCKRNSALFKSLPATPDLFTVPTKLDLSTNFLGPKGLKSLLEVVRVCSDLRELNLRDQQLNNDSIQHLCDVLRTHPTVTHIFLDHNPITIAAGVAILDLVRENVVLEVITLEKTDIRSSVLTTISQELEKNVIAKRPPIAHNIPTTSDCLGDDDDSPSTVTLNASTDDVMVRAALLGIPSSVAPILFDEDPVGTINDLCRRTNRYFADTQFVAEERSVQMSKGSEYGVLGWKRISAAIAEIYGGQPGEEEDDGRQPLAQQQENNDSHNEEALDGIAFEEAEEIESERKLSAVAKARSGHPLFLPGEETFKAFPQLCRRGYSWMFASINAAVPNVNHLKALVSPRVVNPFGVYSVKVYVDGRWRFVVVDDLLPVDQNGDFVFTQPINDMYFWGCIVEKALAKLHGTYQALDMTVPSTLKHPTEKIPSCAATMRDFSGNVGVSRDMWHQDFDNQAWWGSLLNLSERASLIAVSTDAQNRAAEVGIEPLHAYQIRHVRQVNGFYLVNLQSHWARTTYCGKWHDTHEDWATYPLVGEALGIRHKADTSFWMPYHSFLHCFRSVHVLHIHTQLNSRLIESEWTPSTAGGPSFGSTWGNNPHFRMTIVEKSSVFVNITLPDDRFSKTPADTVCFHIIKADMSKVGYVIKFDQEAVVASTEYVITDSVSYQGQLEAGDYWIVPSTYVPDQSGRFFLRALSTGPLVLSKEEESGYWTRRALTVQVPSSGEYYRGEENPQAEIHLPKRNGIAGRLLIKLNIDEVQADEEPTDEQLAGSSPPPSTSRAIALFLLSKKDIKAGSRHVGTIPESSLIAQSKYVINDHVYLEAVIPADYKGEYLTLVGCIAPKGTTAVLGLTIYSSFPTVSVTELKQWPKRSAKAHWRNSAPYQHITNRNPQVELVAASDSANPIYVIKMEVEDTTEPIIGFFVVENYENLGQALSGFEKIPEERIVAKSPYIRHTSTVMEVALPPPGRMMCKSYVIVPSLQPEGSSGTCIITASTPGGGFSLRSTMV